MYNTLSLASPRLKDFNIINNKTSEFMMNVNSVQLNKPRAIGAAVLGMNEYFFNIKKT